MPLACINVEMTTEPLVDMGIEREPTPDEQAGMTWWNEMDERGRRYWMQRAGDTGRAVDAWEAFKRAVAAGENVSTPAS